MAHASPYFLSAMAHTRFGAIYGLVLRCALCCPVTATHPRIFCRLLCCLLRLLRLFELFAPTPDPRKVRVKQWRESLQPSWNTGAVVGAHRSGLQVGVPSYLPAM
eukprot:2074683-Pyramimonas_sp.AAC.1